MKQQLKQLWDLTVRKTIEEKESLHMCQKEINHKNREILQTMLFSVTFILGISFILTFITDFTVSAGTPELKWAYAVIAFISLFFFLYIHSGKGNHLTAMIYIVNTLGVLYAFLVSAFVSPSQVSVTFLFILFMTSTLYLDYGWRIHLFMLAITVAFVTAISFFKDPVVYYAEAMNSYILLLFLYLIGTIVRMARLENFVARRTLHKYAYLDQLTGVYNRRKLFEDFARFESQENTKQITALALLDIDHFKWFNDTYGHQVGDNCLEQLGNCFREVARHHNIRYYRYGGEEFAVAFIDSSKDEVQTYTSNLVNAIRNLKIPHESSPYGIVTVSVGVTHILNEGTPKFEAALSVSDKALYQAKENGRNAAIFADYTPNMITKKMSTLRQRTTNSPLNDSTNQ